MAKYKAIPINLYRLTLQVFVGSQKEFKRAAERAQERDSGYDFVIQDINDSFQDHVTFEAATYYNSKDRILLVYLPSLALNYKNICDIVHELAHVTFAILGDVGIQVDAKNNEAFAYLQGWLAEEVFKNEGWEAV